MPTIAAVFAMIVVLGLLIVVHELGHFLAARWQGIHVNRFSIGFGPALWRFQGPQTEYALRSIPLGGYVGFPDDDPDSPIPADDPNLLRNRPLLDRVIVISAGVIANLVFAYLLLVVQLGIVGVVDYQPGVVIGQVAAEVSPVAADAGLRTQDIVLAIDGQSLGRGASASDTMIQSISKHAGQPLTLTVQRQQQTLDITVIPQAAEDGTARIGVQLRPNLPQRPDGRVARRLPHSLTEVFVEAGQDFERIVSYMVNTFSQFIGNFRETASQVAGPVGIVAIGAEMASTDITRLFDFAAVISINLAFINILPLPALDGGQLAFLLIEAVWGKPLPDRLQEGFMQTGLVLLLSLGVVLIVRDTTQLPWFQQLFFPSL